MCGVTVCKYGMKGHNSDLVGADREGRDLFFIPKIRPQEHLYTYKYSIKFSIHVNI